MKGITSFGFIGLLLISFTQLFAQISCFPEYRMKISAAEKALFLDQTDSSLIYYKAAWKEHDQFLIRDAWNAARVAFSLHQDSIAGLWLKELIRYGVPISQLDTSSVLPDNFRIHNVLWRQWVNQAEKIRKDVVKSQYPAFRRILDSLSYHARTNISNQTDEQKNKLVERFREVLSTRGIPGEQLIGVVDYTGKAPYADVFELIAFDKAIEKKHKSWMFKQLIRQLKYGAVNPEDAARWLDIPRSPYRVFRYGGDPFLPSLKKVEEQSVKVLLLESREDCILKQHWLLTHQDFKFVTTPTFISIQSEIGTLIESENKP
jgi:hypothetical protein